MSKEELLEMKVSREYLREKLAGATAPHERELYRDAIALLTKKIIKIEAVDPQTLAVE